MTFDDATRIRVIRAIVGMDSKSFAARLGICAGTLTGWEKSRSAPQGDNRKALAELCRERGIGFTPSGFPFPMADCVMFKKEEKDGGSGN
jgi:transcriptional regulator with XRE-family HTH domain